MDNCSLDYISNTESDVTFNFHLKNGSRIDLFQMHFNEEFENKRARIILEGGSSIGLNNTESGVVELILRNSDPPDHKLGSEITVKERYLAEGTVTLNGYVLAGARVSLPLGNDTIETVSGPDGSYRFEYTARTSVESDVIQEVPHSTEISVEYLGFVFNMDLDPYRDNDIPVDFGDLSPPTIESISQDPVNFNQQKYITISSVITDEGSEVVSEVILYYRRPGGEWENTTMFNVEGDTYRGILPRSKIGETYEFRIVAVDGVGNIVESEKETVEIGGEFLIAGWIMIVLLVLLVSTASAVKIVRWVRNRNYLRRDFNGERRTLSDFNRKGVI
jgi:hypothetical protein